MECAAGRQWPAPGLETAQRLEAASYMGQAAFVDCSKWSTIWPRKPPAVAIIISFPPAEPDRQSELE